MTNPFIHPTKQQFAAIQKQRFEQAIEGEALKLNLQDILKRPEWIEIVNCPKCNSYKIKWNLSATKECNDCGYIFRSHELI